MNQDVLKNIKQYKWKSMYFKYISSYLGLAIIAYAGLITIFISYFITNMSNLFTEKTFHSTQTTTAILDSEVAEVYTTLVSLLTSDDIFAVTSCEDLSAPPFATLQSLSSIANFTRKSKLDDPDLTDIIIYNPKCNYTIASNESKPLSDFENKVWYTWLTNADTLDRFCIFYENESFYLFQKINSGIILLEFKNFFQLNSDSDTIDVFDKRTDTCLYSSASTEAVSYNIQELESTSLIQKDSTIYVRSEGLHWFNYVYSTPSFNIFSDHTFWSMVLALGIILLVIIVILSVYQTTISYRHITDILALCDTDASFSHNEWTTISNHLINLTNNKMLIEKELMNKMAQIKQLQNLALQAQITPHFLFNTLHMINLSIQETIHGDCQATQMITELSSLLRIALRAGNIITLKEELQHAESYLSLEQMKYEELLNAKWDIDESCLSLQCPKLILQPLLENSIAHGMTEERPLTISVKVHSKPNGISVLISDDGTGMTKEQLKTLYDRMDKPSDNQHIGLSNVIKRLELFYGTDFSYSIESQEDQGVTIRLDIPDKPSSANI